MQVNGRELKVTPASFADARALQKAIGNAIKSERVDIPASFDVDLSEAELSGVLSAVISVAVSDEVEAQLFKCAARALIGEDKVDRDFFEDVDNREFFFPIMLEVAKVNVAPFFKNLASLFSGVMPTKTTKPPKSA